MQIRSKLVAILILPLLGLTVFAGSQVLGSVSTRAAADRLNRSAQLASGLVALVDALQRERATSSGYAASAEHAGVETMSADRVMADTALRSLRERASRQDLAAAGGRLDRLGDFRALVDRGRVAPAQVARFYGDLLESLLVVIGDIGSEHDGGRLGGNAAALIAVARAKEAASQGQDLLLATLVAGRLTLADSQRLAALAGAEQAWLAQFSLAATPDQRALYARTVAGDDVRRAESMRQLALSAPGTPRGLEPGGWFSASSVRLNLLHQVEERLAGDVTAVSAAARTAASRRATLDIVVMLLVVGLAVGSSLVLAASMARPLELLERAVREVAERRLPGVVERLREADEAADLAAIAEEAATAVTIASRDEIGRLASAFNSVHRVAVRVATEQAALHRSIGDMFVNLARRNQALIDRQLNLIEELERRTEDPDHLDELFRLDHLATRMRRNAENLLVLSSAEPARRWSEPASLADVLRAASSEVEQFTRVELRSAEEVRLVGHATSDLVHLLAELIDNAVAFSPPDSPVRVTAQAAAGGYLVEIEDRGVGMTEEALAIANDRLANPPEIDFALSRMLGFFVVGRLAERHGIRAQLRRSWYGGVTAMVLVPSALLHPADEQPRPPSAGALAPPPLAPPPQGYQPSVPRRPAHQPSVFEPYQPRPARARRSP
jgi:signal transduction histidine kinase